MCDITSVVILRELGSRLYALRYQHHHPRSYCPLYIYQDRILEQDEGYGCSLPRKGGRSRNSRSYISTARLRRSFPIERLLPASPLDCHQKGHHCNYLGVLIDRFSVANVVL